MAKQKAAKPKVKRLTETQKAEIRASAEYQDSLSKGKTFLAEEEGLINKVWARLGELADGLTTVYGEGTLKLFAEDLGVSLCLLERRRSTYRAYKNIPVPAPISESALMELQALPDRGEIIAANPDLSKSEARQVRQQRQGKKNGGPQSKEKDDELTNTRRWFNEIIALATDAIRKGETVGRKVPDAVLRQVTDPEQLATVRQGGYALLKIVAYVHHLHDPKKPADWTEDEAVNAAVAQAQADGE